VLLDSLTLFLCVTAGNALTFLTQSTSMRAAIPIGEGLGVSSKTKMSLISMPFGTLVQLYSEGFCLIAVFLSCGVKRFSHTDRQYHKWLRL
jgi:hypothetical protein